jgi:hypothetical protein
VTGYEIIGTNIMQGERLVESPPTRPAALRRALELHKADVAGKPLPTSTGARVLADLPWKNVLTVRPSGSWAANWGAEIATLLHAARGLSNLTRAQLEADYTREGGEPFGAAGGALVTSSAVFEAVRSDEPLLGHDGRTHHGASYTVKDEGGNQTVYSEVEFAELYDVVEAPAKRPAKNLKKEEVA